MVVLRGRLSCQGKGQRAARGGARGRAWKVCLCPCPPLPWGAHFSAQPDNLVSGRVPALPGEELMETGHGWVCLPQTPPPSASLCSPGLVGCGLESYLPWGH